VEVPTRSTKKGPNKGKLKRIVHSLGFECDPSDLPDLRNFSWEKGDDVISNTELSKAYKAYPTTPARKDAGMTESIIQPPPTTSTLHSSTPSSSSYFSTANIDGYQKSREQSINSYPVPIPHIPISYNTHSSPNTPDSSLGYRHYYHHGAPSEGPYAVRTVNVPPVNYHRSDSINSASSRSNHGLWDTNGMHDISWDWVARGQQIPGGPYDYPSRNTSFGSSFPDPLMYPHSRSESINSTGSLIWLDDKRSSERKMGFSSNTVLTESPIAVDHGSKMDQKNDYSLPKSNIPKPGMVKRETSHKNENSETKPHRDKRPVRKKLQSRGSSIGSIDPVEVDNLGSSLEQSTIIDSSEVNNDQNRPQLLVDMGRMTSAMAVKLEFANEVVVPREFIRPFTIQPDDRLISIRSMDASEFFSGDIHTASLISEKPSTILSDRISSAETELTSNRRRH